MSSGPLTIVIDPTSDLGRDLDAPKDTPIYLLRGGKRFRVTRDPPDPWASFNPDNVRAALRKVAGTLTPEEGERIKASIYRGREEGTRPPDRP